MTWVAVVLAWVIVPSHIAWKAYFVFGVPAAGLALAEASRRWARGSRRLAYALGAFFVAVNLTTFDFIGARGQAYAEALSVIFWAYIALLFFVARRREGA
jgi:hypothetical protein